MYVDICRCRSVRVPRVFGLKRCLSMVKFSRSPACRGRVPYTFRIRSMRVEKVQLGKDQEKAQSEKDSHSKNRGGKKPN